MRDVEFQTLSPRNIFSVKIETLTKPSPENTPDKSSRQYKLITPETEAFEPMAPLMGNIFSRIIVIGPEFDHCHDYFGAASLAHNKQTNTHNLGHNGNISDAARDRLPTFQLPWARIWQSSGRLTVKVVIIIVITILIIVIITINTIQVIIRVIETLSGPTCTSAASPRTPPTRTSSISAKSETSLFFFHQLH